MIRVVLQGVTELAVDVIVNAANKWLLGGSGVDGAIHAAGGPEILRECELLRETRYPDGLPAGQAVATTAGKLQAKWVVHTVGPKYKSDPNPPVTLASAYRSTLQVAHELGARTIAFPSISTGVYGYPLSDAAPIAVSVMREFEPMFDEIIIAAFNPATYDAYESALAENLLR